MIKIKNTKLTIIFSTILLTLCTSWKAQAHKIIYFISPPRSLSVACLRMMERFGFEPMHETSNWAYCVANGYKELTKGNYKDDAPSTYEESKERILKKAQTSDVFVKEMSFAANDFLKINKDFISDPRVRFVFLLRNPHHSLISFYNKKKGYLDKQTQEQFIYSAGYQAAYESLKKIKESNPLYQPIIILSEDLYKNSKDTAMELCKYLDIPFSEGCLNWQDLGENFKADEEWDDIKKRSEQIYGWHGDAIRSTSFHEPTKYKVDVAGNPTFEEIENPQHQARCIDAYNENLNYYNLILNEFKDLQLLEKNKS